MIISSSGPVLLQRFMWQQWPVVLFYALTCLKCLSYCSSLVGLWVCCPHLFYTSSVNGGTPKKLQDTGSTKFWQCFTRNQTLLNLLVEKHLKKKKGISCTLFILVYQKTNSLHISASVSIWIVSSNFRVWICLRKKKKITWRVQFLLSSDFCNGKTKTL